MRAAQISLQKPHNLNWISVYCLCAHYFFYVNTKQTVNKCLRNGDKCKQTAEHSTSVVQSVLIPAVPEELLWSMSRVCRKRSELRPVEAATPVAAENDLAPFITQQQYLHSVCFSSLRQKQQSQSTNGPEKIKHFWPHQPMMVQIWK